MVCQEIDVKTKYYEENAEGLKLHIPNYDGCFFIELDDTINNGTELKLYLDNSVEDKKNKCASQLFARCYTICN